MFRADGAHVAYVRPMSDDDLTDPRSAAVARIKAKRNLTAQAGIFMVSSVVLIAIWAAFDRGFFWPIFPMFGFAMALFGQWRALTASRPITEDEIRREMGQA